MTRLLYNVAASFVVVLTTNGVAQMPIPIRDLTTIEATSTEIVGFVNGVRELSDGRVLVNDAGKRRLLLFDKSLSSARAVADTVSGSKAQYGSRATGIIPYIADSTLLVDLAGRAFLLIDAEGKVARVMSAPRPNDVASMMNPGMGAPSFDKSGRLIYRTMVMPPFRAPVVGKQYTPPVMPDSAPLLRADFDSRVADTIGWVRTPRIKINTLFLPNGGVTLTPVFSPISTIDDWTMLPDGSVAIIRGSDYHVDWIAPDGTRSSSAKMPFDWKRLSDDDKTALIDSTKKALERQAKAGSGSGSSGPAPGPGSHGGAVIPSGHSMTIMPVGGDDGAPAPQSASKGPSLPQVAEVVEPADLPDYYPPILQTGEMRADFAGNVWILPSTTTQLGRGLMYDVVNRRGELVERIRLPQGRALEGFGADGAVYLTSHGAGGTRLERARIAAHDKRPSTPSMPDSAKALVGTWEGSYTSDHAPSGAMKLVFTRDTVVKISSLALEMAKEMQTVTVRNFAVTTTDISWTQDMMGMTCEATAVLKNGQMKGAIVCGHGSVTFVLTKR